MDDLFKGPTPDELLSKFITTPSENWARPSPGSFAPMFEWRKSWSTHGRQLYRADHDWPHTVTTMNFGHIRADFTRWNKPADQPTIWLVTPDFPHQVVLLGRPNGHGGIDLAGQLDEQRQAFVLSLWPLFSWVSTGWATYGGSAIDFGQKCIPWPRKAGFEDLQSLVSPHTERLADRLARMEDLT